MHRPFLNIAFVCGLALLSLQDALAARRSLRVDFGSWSDALVLGSENCPGSSPEGPDVTWRGIVFSGTTGPWFDQDVYCQEANQKGIEFQEPYDYLSDESTPFDEPGLAALIGPNDDSELSNRVTAIRYTYLDEDRFSEDPFPEGFQWAFYQFPGDFTIVALYGDIDQSIINPVIHDQNGIIWSEAEDGFDGEYFCFDESTFIGTWDGEPDDGSPLSRCEFVLKELIFDEGFEAAGESVDLSFLTTESGISISDGYNNQGLVFADMDGVNGEDMVAGSLETTLYLNNGTPDPFNGVDGKSVSFYDHPNRTQGFDVGDVDGINGPDIVFAVRDDLNRLHLNNGTADPFNGVTGLAVGSDALSTNAIALADLDGVNGLDLVTGNYQQGLRLYPNNGSADPFGGVDHVLVGEADGDANRILAVDMNGDSLTDLLTSAWYGPVLLYLSKGGAQPFDGISGTNLSPNGEDSWYRIAAGDVNGDTHPDLVVIIDGNSYRDHYGYIFLNNQTATPFKDVIAYPIIPELVDVNVVTLADVDNDGDLDLILANETDANRLYQNDGGPTPFANGRGLIITQARGDARSLAAGDPNGDGKTDIVIGGETFTTLYLNQ